MQSITYIVPLPVVGDRLTIDILPETYIITELESNQPPFDSALIQNEKTNEVSRIVVVRGKWQVEYLAYPHEITFIGKAQTPTIGTRGRYVRSGYIQLFTVVEVTSPKELRIRFDPINPFDPTRVKAPLHITTIMAGDKLISFRANQTWVFKGTDTVSMSGRIEFD